MRPFLIEFIIMFFMMLVPSIAQVGTEPDASIDELAQFNYMIGDWRVEMNSRQEDGTYKLIENTADVSAFFHADGYTFQTIFTMKNGFFSTDIRTFNKDENKWQVMFLNAKAQRWHKFYASVDKGNMTTMIPGGYSGNEEFDIKIVDLDIKPDSFIKHVYRSLDHGKNWDQLYIMRYSRQTDQ